MQRYALCRQLKKQKQVFFSFFSIRQQGINSSRSKKVRGKGYFFLFFPIPLIYIPQKQCDSIKKENWFFLKKPCSSKKALALSGVKTLLLRQPQSAYVHACARMDVRLCQYSTGQSRARPHTRSKTGRRFRPSKHQ